MSRMEKMQFVDGARFAATPAGRARTASDVRDSACVDIESWNSRHYWCARLGLSETQLVRAVRAVGSAVMDIEAYLEERRRRRALRHRPDGLA